MSGEPLNVLFLCTGNSARSIMAERLVERWGEGKFLGFSAGSYPKGEIHPLAIAMLKEADLPTEGLRSKSWDEFATAGAPAMDFVFTVCDDAAGEICPVWPGQPMTAHWGILDPAAVEGSGIQKEAAFVTAFRYLKNRISVFTALPLKNLDKIALGTKLREIGRSEGATSPRPSAA